MIRKVYSMIPSFIRGWIQLIRVRIHFRGQGNQLDSYLISLSSTLKGHVRIPRRCLIFGSVTIGRYTYMQTDCEINNATIGNFCSLGSHVLIGPWEHPLHQLSTSPRVYRELGGGKFPDAPKHTVIGDDVWIGSYVIILDGVHIGNGAVIGAGAVVTKDIPPYGIAVGNPAKVVKFRFSDKIINTIQRSNWYQLDDAHLKQQLIQLNKLCQ